MTAQEESYRTIQLTQRQVTLVDDKHFLRLSQWKWQAHWNPCTKSFYAVRSQRVTPGRKGKRICVWMHREILGLGYRDGKKGDHIESGNTLDNRESNLRVATHCGNAQNARIRKDNTSGSKGVNWFPSTRKWIARIQVNNQRLCLGYFKQKKDAVEAYRVAALEYHGEFARTK